MKVWEKMYSGFVILGYAANDWTNCAESITAPFMP
jgi:hypothetical protein